MDTKFSSILVIALIMIFIFGSTFYLGVLNPAELAPTDGMSSARVGGRYHVYNPLASSPLGFIVAFFVFIWALGDVSERVKSTIPRILSLIGIILLIMSIYNLVSGIHDLLTFTAYETTIKPTIGQQYGWLIQFFVYGILGSAIIYASEYLRKQAGEKRSLIPSATLPIAYFLFLSTLYIFTTGFHISLYATDTEYRQSLAWVIETFIFGVMTYAFFWISEKIRREEGAARSVFSFPASSMGVLFILLTLGAYLFGTIYYVYSEDSQKNISWLVESFVFGAIGIASSLMADELAKRNSEESGAFSGVMYVAGTILLFSSLLQFIDGFNKFLYSYNPDLNWFVEFILLVVPGTLAIIIGEYTRRKVKTTPSETPAVKLSRKAK